MKKLLLILFGVLTALQTFADTFSYTYKGQTLTYYVYLFAGGGDATVTGGRPSGDLIIPSVVTYADREFPVTSIGEHALKGCSGLTSVTIPESVTSIGLAAFSGCSGLTSVTIPESVTSIDEHAFEGCSGLTSVTIPESVTSIDSYTFSLCSGLTSVTIPNSVTSIGSYAFRNCSGLTSVTIPESVTSIGNDAFSGCSGLTSVTIPESVTSIGKRAFSGCSDLETLYFNAEKCSGWTDDSPFPTTIKEVIFGESVKVIPQGVCKGFSGLTSVTIPNSVNSIGQSAFEGCSGLSSVTIPISVDSIGQSAFDGCSGIETLYFNAWNCSGWGSDSPFPTSIKEVIFGESVKVVPARICYRFESLTSVTIPNAVTSIGNGAFSSCTGLTSVTIGTSVNSIGSNAFYKCTGLSSVTIPNSVTSIDNWAFGGCSGLTSVIIPNAVTKIGETAFKACTGLSKSAYPSTLSSNPFENGVSVRYPAAGAVIEDGFVWGPSKSALYFVPLSLKGDFVLPSGVKTIGSSAFYGCSGLSSVTIPNSVTSIGSYAFYGCSGLETLYFNAEKCTGWTDDSPFPTTIKEVKFGESVKVIPAHICAGCTRLTSVTIPSSVTSIGSYAFQGCSGLSSVTIPNAVTEIKQNAFDFCSGLTKAEFASVESLCKIQFESLSANPLYSAHHLYIGGKEVKDLVIPNTVTSIGSYAFFDCSGLSSVTIPNSVTSIGSYAFYGCSGLTSVTIPSSVTSIGSYAFQGCSNLKTVTSLCENPPVINDDSFSGLYYKVKAIVPDNCLTTYLLTNWSLFSNLRTSGGVEAKSFTDDVFKYRVNGEKSVMLLAGDYSGMESVSIPERVVLSDQFYFVTYIADNAFKGCKNIKSLVLPKSLEVIGVSAFEDANINAAVLTLPSTLEKIHDSAFKGCTGISTVSLPETVNYLGKAAFAGSSVSKINIPTAPGTGCFENAVNLASVTFSENVDAIAASTFAGCTALTSVTISNSVGSIGEKAFYGCSALEEVIFGSSVENIATEAFRDCKLTDIVLSPATKTIRSNAFVGNDLKNIAIGAEIEEIGANAFDGSNNLAGVSITAINPPAAENNTFSYYGCPLYVMPSENDVVKDAYYNFPRCWYRFSCHDLIPIKEVKISNASKIDLEEGESVKLEATFSPANASLPYIFWRSTNPDYATVDSEGNVTRVKRDNMAPRSENGCQIIAETLYADGPVAVVKLAGGGIGIEATGVKLDRDNVSLKVGETATLVATVLPENAADKTVTWKSSNKDVATVDAKGVITALKEGNAVITATCGSVSASCQVTVVPVSGVDEIFGDAEGRVDIYNMQGQSIKLGATADDVKALAPGMYIIAGKKVVIK